MVFSFLKSYASTKVKDAANSTIEALVAFDPQGATEAQIDMMDEQLNALGLKVAATTREYEEAIKGFEAAKTLNRTRLTAAETLQAAIDAGDTSKSKSLDSLLTIIDQAQPDLEALKTNAAEVKAYLDDIQAAHKSAAEKLRGARAQLSRARTDMERAKIAEGRSKDRADAAAIAAGIHSGGDALNIALSAMNKKATAARDAAVASDLKASTLAPADHEKSDPNIAEAMNAAKGTPTAAPQSSAERLAALKNRAAA